jgi:hypothetical protein
VLLGTGAALQCQELLVFVGFIKLVSTVLDRVVGLCGDEMSPAQVIGALDVLRVCWIDVDAWDYRTGNHELNGTLAEILEMASDRLGPAKPRLLALQLPAGGRQAAVLKGLIALLLKMPPDQAVRAALGHACEMTVRYSASVGRHRSGFGQLTAETIGFAESPSDLVNEMLTHEIDVQTLVHVPRIVRNANAATQPRGCAVSQEIVADAVCRCERWGKYM